MNHSLKISLIKFERIKAYNEILTRAVMLFLSKAKARA